MLGRLNTKMDSFDERIVGIEGEVSRIKRHWNILVLDAEIEEDLGEYEEEDLLAND